MTELNNTFQPEIYKDVSHFILVQENKKSVSNQTHLAIEIVNTISNCFPILGVNSKFHLCFFDPAFVVAR